MDITLYKSEIEKLNNLNSELANYKIDNNKLNAELNHINNRLSKSDKIINIRDIQIINLNEKININSEQYKLDIKIYAEKYDKLVNEIEESKIKLQNDIDNLNKINEDKNNIIKELEYNIQTKDENYLNKIDILENT